MQPSVWAVWPTVHFARSRAMVKKWHAQGYKVAILVNPPFPTAMLGADKIITQKEWRGFPTAANMLCHGVPGDVIAVVGDDVYPDPNKTAQEIGADFVKKFPDLFGVMQPTGDAFASVNTCAVSPWVGRKFITDAYAGRGPYCSDYFHYFTDYELQLVATKLGAFYQRKDIVQFHDHWQREVEPVRPPHLTKAYIHWRDDERIFKNRKSIGFPNHERGALDSTAHDNAWRAHYAKGSGGLESVNGPGSYLANTSEIKNALPTIFKKFNIKTFVDVGCGDWNWMQHVDLSSVDYLGCDLVEAQIEANRAKFPGVKFKQLNVITDPIPKCDLVLCRDLLFQIPTPWVYAAIQNIRRSAKWLLATSFPEEPRNTDIPGGSLIGWRPVNMVLPPFGLPAPEYTVQENRSSTCRGRIVGMFNLGIRSELP